VSEGSFLHLIPRAICCQSEVSCMLQVTSGYLVFAQISLSLSLGPFDQSKKLRPHVEAGLLYCVYFGLHTLQAVFQALWGTAVYRAAQCTVNSST